jgi:transposase-like protein
MHELLSALRDAKTLTPELRARSIALYLPISEIHRRTGIKVSTLKKWCRNHLNNVDTLQKVPCDVRGKRKTIYASVDDALECAERARARTSAGRKLQ